MSSTLFVINPHSRGGKTKSSWPKYLRHIEQNYSHTFDFKMADGIGSGYDITRNAIDDGYTTLIGVGGEGTINELVNGIYFSQKTNLNLGFIQSGTVNDYQQVIEWPKQIEEQIKALNVAQTKITPLTFVSGDKERVALNIADTGIGATIAYMASIERRLKWIKSGFRYTLLSLRAIRKWKNIGAKIRIDDRYIEGDLTLLMAGFSTQTGEYKILPHANIWGDQMAYTVAIGFSKLSMLKLLGVLKKGEHTEEISGVYMGHANKISIETEKPLIFETDGEPFSYESTEIIVKAIPKAINVIQA
ncbi:MAG: Diacylglycerol kinase [Candidatus Heimdallarchaeota archaeon LC_2]|nr:MAG: Diacylglycerol kinase [Candidatus Heimdallarchaeota archaeon LC_2]OLS28575.1 MAG: Diacylglycerol kinase [Candidatus Heimdallarchaeota archaeon LC_2]